MSPSLDAIENSFNKMKVQIEKLIADCNNHNARVEKECDEKVKAMEEKMEKLKNIDGLVARLMEKKNSWWMADAIEEGVYRRAVESIIEEIDEDK
jgi:hypothetical protein